MVLAKPTHGVRGGVGGARPRIPCYNDSMDRLALTTLMTVVLLLPAGLVAGPPQDLELSEADSLTPLIQRMLYQGHYVDAFITATRQVEIRTRHLGPLHPETAASHHQIGVILRGSGQRARANDQLRFTLELRRLVHGEAAPETVETFIAFVRSSNETVLRDDHERMDALVEEARELVELIDSDGVLAAAWFNLAAHVCRGHHPDEEILARYDRAIEILSRELGPSHPDVASALCWKGHFQVRCEDYAAAEATLRRTLGAAGMCNVDSLGIMPATYGALAKSLRAQGKRAEAESYLSLSLEAQARAAESFPLNFGLRRTLSGVSNRVAFELLLADKPDEAWNVLDAGHGRLTDALQVPRRYARSSDTRNAEWNTLRHAVLRSGREVSRIGSETEVDLAVASAARVEYLVAEAALAQFDRQARTALEARVVVGDLRGVQRYLGPNDAIIGWDRLIPLAHVIRNRGPVHWVPQTEENISEAIDAESRTMKSIWDAAAWPVRVAPDGQLTADVQQAWKRRVLPLMPYLEGVERLVVLDQTIRHQLPIECLVDDRGDYLIERYSVVYVPSARHFARWSEQNERDAQPGDPERMTALFVADPAFDGSDHLPQPDPWDNLDDASLSIVDKTTVRSVLSGQRGALQELPRLPMARYEALKSAGLFGESVVLLGTRASEGAIDALDRGRFTVIHLATHALVDRWWPDRSSLVVLPNVSPEADWHDGLLTTRDVYLGWDLDAELVVLSACQSGHGEETPTDGRIGFHQALFAAGADAVVSSLWPVDDVATALLMFRFYENLLGAYAERRSGFGAGTPMRKVDALREAKLWLKAFEQDDGTRPFAHPVYWGGFILTGDPD